jgi:hypothetical protein
LLLQLCLAPLRDGAALLSLQRELRGCEHDLDAWRSSSLLADRCDFSALDASFGAGWDLARRLVCPRSGGKHGSRLSAAAAARHRFLWGEGLFG